MEGTQRVTLGIDLGGTYLRAGVISPQGKVLGWAEGPIEAVRGPVEGLGRIEELSTLALRQAGDVELTGIGIGATGPIDRDQGTIQNPYTLPTWENVDILTPLHNHFKVPVVLENDADAAVLGEYWKGAGHKVPRLVMVTIGTGVGTAFLLHGELYRGLDGVHPETGHMVIDPNGPVCYCGAHGCLESLTSGTAIGQIARSRAAGDYPQDYPQVPQKLINMAGGHLQDINAEIVAEAARQGDPFACDIIQEAAYFLGLGLVNLIVTFLPEKILLAGGVMKSFPLFQPILKDTITRHNVVVPAQSVKIELAKLGNQAGVIGAAYAALKSQ